MNRIQKAKQHVKEHKAVYITGGVCLAVDALFGGVYASTRPDATNMVKMQNIGLTWKPRQEVLQVAVTIEELSTPSKPLVDQTTKSVYNSINDAVRKTGRTRTSILKDPAFKLLGDVSQEIHAT